MRITLTILYLVSKADRGVLRWLLVKAGMNRSCPGPGVGFNEVVVAVDVDVGEVAAAVLSVEAAENEI